MRITLCFLGTVLAGHAAAEAPNVAVDIAPVHSLVSRVMDGVGEPDLIIPPGTSPHHHSMRPSEARALQSADVVFWVGEELTPWMEKPLGALSGDAQTVALLDVDGTVLYDFRDVVEDGHEDDHDDHGHDDHADQDEHADHADQDEHADHADHDDHADHADDAHHHDHDGVDPHAWLDPENARVWVQAIAKTLAEADPENAETYRSNAQAADAELAALSDQIASNLSDMQARKFITFHDAYQYFEKRFGLSTSGSVSLGDASNPGPARLSELQDKVAADGINCAFAEPQFDTRLVETAIEGSGATIFELDPLGIAIEPGKDQYPALLIALTGGYQSCANGS